MPPRDISFGNDTLSIPCYLAKGPDDPGFLQWARDHPDWIVAGSWTSAASPGGGDRPNQGAAEPDPSPPIDPTTTSLDDTSK